jgi:hypothetical protein
MSLYLEISGRCSLKTKRLCRAANAHAGIAIVVCHSENNKGHIAKLVKTDHVYTLGEVIKLQRQGALPTGKHVRYFFDEFDHMLLEVPFYIHGYYVTTPARLRTSKRLKKGEQDLLLRLLKWTKGKYAHKVNEEFGPMMLRDNKKAGMTKKDIQYRLQAKGEFVK